LKALALSLLLACGVARPLPAQDLSPEDVRIDLDSAIHLARSAAAAAVPNLSSYLLYSVAPRVFKNDPGGLHWQVTWQERAFPHRRGLVVRVYMKDGHPSVETGDE
jgi:hypothetical protein